MREEDKEELKQVSGEKNGKGQLAFREAVMELYLLRTNVELDSLCVLEHQGQQP